MWPQPRQPGRSHEVLEYSDGGGNVLVKKVQAEPEHAGQAPLRWVASGKTVLNNKGKPVKQYEPYFSRRRSAIASTPRRPRTKRASHR